MLQFQLVLFLGIQQESCKLCCTLFYTPTGWEDTFPKMTTFLPTFQIKMTKYTKISYKCLHVFIYKKAIFPTIAKISSYIPNFPDSRFFLSAMLYGGSSLVSQIHVTTTASAIMDVKFIAGNMYTVYKCISQRLKCLVYSL